MVARVINLGRSFYSNSVKNSGIRTVHTSTGYIASVFMIIFILNISLNAQGFSWPENPKNIQVLPEEITGSRLGFVMGIFSLALGESCDHCHFAEEGAGLGDIDFASDANPNKEVAREMLRMVNDIKDRLAKIEPSRTNPVAISCNTCHRGLSRPIPLEDQLRETFRADGVEAALTHYSELKEKYYGTGSYQFGENALNNLGYVVLPDNPAGAVKVFKLNTKEYPKSANAWDSLAEGYMKAGDMKKAKKYYKKTLKMNPKNRNAEKMLEEIKKGK